MTEHIAASGLGEFKDPKILLQAVLEYKEKRILMWEDGTILLEHKHERSVELTIQEVSFIFYQWQIVFGALPISDRLEEFRVYQLKVNT